MYVLMVDEEKELAIAWHGRSTFNVHLWCPAEDTYPAMLGMEVRCVTLGGIPDQRPSEAQALAAMKEWIDASDE